MAFTPRLTSSGMQGNPWWYSNGNPFYASNYGLPNCTCYAYGRYAEIRNGFAALPISDGGQWWGDVSAQFQKGQTPALGAVACWYDPNGGAGHVAIVEELQQNGDITTSNSAWRSTYFYLEHLTRASNYQYSNYIFQGFIYMDMPFPVYRRKMPLWMLAQEQVFAIIRR